MLGAAAVAGQVRGCAGFFRAVLANSVLMLRIRSERCRQGPAWPCVAPGAHLLRGVPLNAFKKLCILHLATTGMRRRGYLFPCP